MPTVLVVDDNADNRRLLHSLLGSRGYVTVEAGDGREGLAAARALIGSGSPDAVLLDLHMPVLDGYGFLAEWTSDPALVGIPVLMVTADTNETLRGMEAGAHDFVTKPFDLEELLVRLSAAVRVKALHDRLQRQAPTSGR